MPKGYKISEEQKERIRTMLLEGYLPVEIAEQERVSAGAVRNIQAKLPYADKNRHNFPAGILTSVFRRSVNNDSERVSATSKA